MVKFLKPVFLFGMLFFFATAAFSQYTGGNGAGANLDAIELSVCSATSETAYSGGSSGGFDSETLSNGSCAVEAVNPFLGGDADGFSVSDLENSACAITSINPFLGGDADGFSISESENSVCEIVGINPYLGGIDDGYALGETLNTLCTVIGLNPYWGGTADGFSFADIVASLCDVPAVSAYSGGLGDGHFASPNATYAVWQGDDATLPTDWHTAENWNVNSVPDANLNVTIPASANDPIISASAESGCLNISTLAELTISSGADLTVSKFLQNEGDLHLLTPPNSGATGSLIVNQSISGSGTVHFQRYYNVSNRWQYTTPPFSNINSNAFTRTGANFNVNFYHYSEPFDLATDPTGAIYANWQQLSAAWLYAHNGSAGAATTLNKGTGYIWYNESDQSLSFSNVSTDLSNNDLVFPVTFNSNDGNSDYFDGWNLIGNPYPSAIDWDAFAKTNIANTVYYWDGDNQRYVYYNGATGTETGDGSNYVNGGTQYIPSLQGFFVKATANGNFTIPRTARTHNAQTLWKSDKSDRTPYVKLTVNSGEKSDELCVRFKPEATTAFDDDFDAYKMFAYTNPNFFSISDSDIPLAINTLPLFTEDLIIPLGFTTSQNKTYTISLNTNTIGDDYDVYLIDLSNNVETKLSENNYLFNYQSANELRYFELKFIPQSSHSLEIDSDNEILIYASGKSIFIQNPFLKATAEEKYYIYNSLGQLVKFGKYYTENAEITTNFPTGIYLVMLVSKNKTTVKSVFLGQSDFKLR